ncbi:MAG TPA: T9SS type A sorting domain-containing protein, partial [Bacteroidia bacterium]|nr:T9SS type A sorting domain-containing protein [Bacteroidia bacterium]
GCSAIDSVHIAILPLPNFSVSGAPLNICLGDTSRMYCSDPTWAYTWAPAVSLNVATGDSVFATPASSTTYSITAVDTNGCVNSTTKIVTVYPPLPLPTVLINGWVLTCSTPGYSYQWYLNGNPIPGATAQTYTATVVGNYSVEARSYQNCYSGISPAVMVDGIEEHDGIAFTIAPNPNNGLFDLSFGTIASADFSITIFAADGKLVYLEELPEFSGTYKKQIDLSHFGSGMYLIKLTNDKQQSVQHILVF